MGVVLMAADLSFVVPVNVELGVEMKMRFIIMRSDGCEMLPLFVCFVLFILGDFLVTFVDLVVRFGSSLFFPLKTFAHVPVWQ